MSVLCFLRGLSFKMILAYIKDGKCTQYKYVKKITRVLVFAFLVRILVLYEGKITDEQYKTVAQKYNEIRKEMKEIKERAHLCNTKMQHEFQKAGIISPRFFVCFDLFRPRLMLSVALLFAVRFWQILPRTD